MLCLSDRDMVASAVVLVGWLGGLVGWFVGWSVGRLVGWFFGRLVGRSFFVVFFGFLFFCIAYGLFSLSCMLLSLTPDLQRCLLLLLWEGVALEKQFPSNECPCSHGHWGCLRLALLS